MKTIDVITLLGEVGITLNHNNEVVLTKDKLELIVQRLRTPEVFFEDCELPSECFVLIDQNTKAFYPFNREELNEWNSDGSFEKGDKLYRMELVKVY